MNEVDIKAALLSLPTVRRGRPIVASEFVVGPRVRRADLVVQSDELTAFEIKSDFDNLDRLSAQADEYARYFNKVVVVVTSRHLKKALEILSGGVDVWEISSDHQTRIIREASECALKNHRNALNLLTKSERYRYVGKDLQPDLFESEQHRVKRAVEKAFANRHGFHSQIFWKAVGRKKVQPAHLALLSRFSEERKRAAAKIIKNEDFWRNWHIETAKFLGLESSGSPEVDAF